MLKRGAFAPVREAMTLDWSPRPAPSIARPPAPAAPPLNSRGIRANQRQARLREAIIRQPNSDLFRALCLAYHRHLLGEDSLDHISTLERAHEKTNRDYKINLTQRSFAKACLLAYDEMTRLASVKLKRRVIDEMDAWSMRAWRERIRAIDEGDRGEAFVALRAAYEDAAKAKLLSDDQFMKALKMAAGMRRKRSSDDDVEEPEADPGQFDDDANSDMGAPDNSRS